MLAKKLKILLWLYIILLHVFIAMVLVKTDIASRIYTKLGFTEIKHELTPHYHAMLSYHKRIDKNIDTNSVIFIGDSITQGLAVSAVHEKAVNFGIGEDTTYGVKTRVKDYNAIKKSKLIVLAIGINDLKYRNNQEIFNNYIEIFELIPADKTVLISAILPVDEISPKKINYNKRIRAINIKLKEMALKSEYIYFIDISKDLIDSQGNLDDKFHDGDGVHLSYLGYQVWINNLKDAVLTITEK